MRKHKKEELFDLVPRAAFGRLGERGLKKGEIYAKLCEQSFRIESARELFSATFFPGESVLCLAGSLLAGLLSLLKDCCNSSGATLFPE